MLHKYVNNFGYIFAIKFAFIYWNENEKEKEILELWKDN